MEIVSSFLLANHFKKKGIALIILGILIALTGFFLSWLGFKWSHEATVQLPYYSPFLDIAQYSMLVGLLVLVFSKEKHEDEYIHAVRLKSFYLSMLITAALLVLNEAIYFFADKLIIAAITVILIQLILNVLFMKINLSLNKPQNN